MAAGFTGAGAVVAAGAGAGFGATGAETAGTGTFTAGGAGMLAPGVTVIGAEVAPPGVRLMTGEALAPGGLGAMVGEIPPVALVAFSLNWGIPGVGAGAAGSFGFGGPSTSFVGSLAAIHFVRTSP